MYELSKELGVENRDVLAACKALDINVKSHSSSMSEEDASRIRDKVPKSAGISSVRRATARPLPKKPVAKRPVAKGGAAKSPIKKKQQILEIRRPAPAAPAPSESHSNREVQELPPDFVPQVRHEIKLNWTSGKAQHFLEKLGDGVALDMVQIPAGSFLMGSPDDELERSDAEGPQHSVKVPSFFMGRYPVTQAQWRVVARMKPVNSEIEMKLNPSNFEGDDRPVEQVNWFEAQEFCARLSATTPGRIYRLPSEAEWEYACRAGTQTAFCFGETLTTNLANYRGTEWKEVGESGQYGRGPKGEYREETMPVGRFPANDFGLHDLHGNVWEWCEDEWHGSYKGAPEDGSAWVDVEATDERNRVLRGGSWFNYPRHCRSAFRNSDTPGNRVNSYGFRVVCVSARTP